MCLWSSCCVYQPSSWPFAAAILYTAGLLTSQSTGRLKEERSYLLAQSFAEALDKELSDPDASFFEFVNRFLDGNQYAEDTPYSFMPEGTDLENLYAAAPKVWKATATCV